jgi:glycosyltransferase involved in cell wall biosynthesis
MACILKAPAAGAKGIVTFTTPERDKVIFKDRELRRRLEQLKERWVFGLHHNWHDYNLKYDPLFDFHMAGEEDLREVSGREIPLIPLDACNFSPSCFAPGGTDKFWDILYVARAVSFKRIPEFFRFVRSLYDQGHRCRVLLVCPVPAKGGLPEVRREYDRLFTAEEQDRFTLLTMDYRYPFPLDLETLAHFYRSSRIFVHTADDERRCRVTGYAWACGMPVVAMPCVGSLLPGHLRREPYYFEALTYDDFPSLAIRALASTSSGPLDLTKARELVAEDFTRESLARYLSAHVPAVDAGDLAANALDIRLGRHHNLSSGKNRVNQPLAALAGYLEGRADELVRQDLLQGDPESYIAALAEFRVSPGGGEGLMGRSLAGVRRLLSRKRAQ